MYARKILFKQKQSIALPNALKHTAKAIFIDKIKINNQMFFKLKLGKIWQQQKRMK
jgi:hypothetical protein